jgi:hypothetical protein
MYSRCIFCSHALGRNETLEAFPVGSMLAFDSLKGRLWAVCPGCGRWNLAPIEERWEAVEQAEQRFRDTRLRVQSENIGVAQLPESTRLIRIGDVLPGELTAWRYGNELRRRWRSQRVRQALEVIAGALLTDALLVSVIARQEEIVYRVRGSVSPTGEELLVREADLRGSRVQTNENGALQISLPDPLSTRARLLRLFTGRVTPHRFAVAGDEAHNLLCRALIRVNASGASERDLQRALELMERHGSPETILSGEVGGTLTLAERRWSVTKRLQGRGGQGPLPRPTLLALEMLLHEEAERRALAGELLALREQWREAEEIAAIADTLLDDPQRFRRLGSKRR